MSKYERVSIFLGIITIVIASYIGYIQNSINQELVDFNFEPSLVLGYSQPISDTSDFISGLTLKNEGKTNIIYYAYNTFPENIKDKDLIFTSSSSNVVTPGDTSDLIGSNFYSFIQNLVKQNAGEKFLVDVIFKTADNQKYLIETPISATTTNRILMIYFEGGTIRKFDWSLQKNIPDSRL